LSQLPNRQQKNRNLQASALSGAFAYSFLSGALLVVRNASAMSPVGELNRHVASYLGCLEGRADIAQVGFQFRLWPIVLKKTFFADS
jgi:hypothetical protein